MTSNMLLCQQITNSPRQILFKNLPFLRSTFFKLNFNFRESIIQLKIQYLFRVNSEVFGL